MSIFRRLINLVRTSSVERDIQREMAFHIRERADELRAQGMSEADAAQLAQRQFGNRGLNAEATRDADVVTSLDTLRGDVRYTLRGLVRSPVFTVVAIASLALGIGANAAIFTLIDAVVLRELDVPQPQELVQVTTSEKDEDGYFTNPLWEQLRDRQSGFASIAAFGETSFDISRGGEARRVPAEWVSGQYFTLFGMQAAAGRLLTPDDDRRGCQGIAVLSHAFWQSDICGFHESRNRSLAAGLRSTLRRRVPEWKAEHTRLSEQLVASRDWSTRHVPSNRPVDRARQGTRAGIVCSNYAR